VWLDDVSSNTLHSATAWLNFDTVADITCVDQYGNTRLWRCRKSSDVPVHFEGMRVVRVTVSRSTPNV
jgi:hypothetical protein